MLLFAFLACPLAIQSAGELPQGGTVEIYAAITGGPEAKKYGNTLAGGGDLNGDGVSDFLVGDESATLGGFVDARSGADGSLLYRIYGATDSESFGASLSFLGDLDGDGIDDFLVGAPQSGVREGATMVYSGQTGSLILSIHGLAGDALGSSVCAAGDANGDGVGDFAVGVPGAGRDGEVRIYSGADGSVLATGSIYSPYPNSFTGSSLAFAGDFFGTGKPYVIYGAPGYEPYAGHFAGAAGILCIGQDSIISSLGYGSDEMGSSVEGIPDVNGDGRDDVLVGIPGQWAVEAYSSNPWGELLYRSEAIGIGFSITTVGDLNHDGVQDFLAGGYGRVHAFSGKDGKKLFSLFGRQPAQRNFGDSSACLGDLNGDGNLEFLVGAPYAALGTRHRSGVVYIMTYYPGLSSSVDQISSSLGGQMQLQVDFPATMAGQAYHALIARDSGPPIFGYRIPLNGDSMLLDSTQGIYPQGQYVGMQGNLNPQGDALIDIVLPAAVHDLHAGKDFWFAVLALPSSGLPSRCTVARRVLLTP